MLGSTNYEMASLNLGSGAKMAVTGNAVLMVDGNVSMASSSTIDIIPPGTLTLYVAGASADLGGGANNTGWATNFVYYGLPSNKSVTMAPNGPFTGAIYAPSADLKMNGGGSGDQNFVGSCVVRSININGHYKFHYDEALAKNGPPSLYIVTSWLEL